MMVLQFNSLAVSSVVITVIVCLCKITSCQINYLPDVPCTNMFQYLYVENVIIGIITVADVRHGKTRIVVELSQPGAYNLTYFGKISLQVDKDKVYEYINRGRAFTYRVDFPLQNVVPRVTSIDVNGEQGCYGPKYALPSTTMILEHTLTTYPLNSNTKPSGNFWQPNFNQDPNFRKSSIPESELSNKIPLSNQPSFNQQLPLNDQSTNQPFFNPSIYTQPIYKESAPEVSENFQIHYFDANHRAENDAPVYFNPSFASKIAEPTESALEESMSPEPSSTTIPDKAITIQPSTFQATFEYINSVCGQENVNFAIEKLNVKGSPIFKSRFPWIAAIFRRVNGDFSFQCGGSLISTRTVISAAHCFYSELEVIKADHILISMGLHDLSQWYNAKNIGVEEVIQHPDYNLNLIKFDADLAIVRLKQSVIFTTSVRPICMWEGSADTRDIEGLSGAIVGWGSDGHRDSTIIPTLVNATIVSEITCIRSNDLFISLTSNRTLCVGNLDGSGPCAGDSGNGLMIKNRNKWMLRGTVSAGLGSPTRQCPLDEYVVFSDTAKFSAWILSNMLL